MRVTVVGAGAIGGTVGVLLHRAGHQVVLVDRDAAHVATINRDGFRLERVMDFSVARFSCPRGEGSRSGRRSRASATLTASRAHSMAVTASRMRAPPPGAAPA